MKRILVSWVGRIDLRAVEESDSIGLGPIAQAVDAAAYDDIVLISDYPEQDVTSYLGWLATRTLTKITPHVARLTSPTNFAEIYEAAVATVAETKRSCMAAIYSSRFT
jgi:hypothetical protein